MWTLPQAGQPALPGGQGSGFYRRREPDVHLCLQHGAGKTAARADVTRVSSFGVTAEHHSLDHICDIGALVGRDFVFHAEIAPAKPMITEDLTEPVMAGGVIRVLKRRKNDFLRAIWRILQLYGGSIQTSVAQPIPSRYTFKRQYEIKFLFISIEFLCESKITTRNQ